MYANERIEHACMPENSPELPCTLTFPSSYLSERHDLHCSLPGIQLMANGLEPVAVLLHQSPGNDVAVSGRLNLVYLLCKGQIPGFTTPFKSVDAIRCGRV